MGKPAVEIDFEALYDLCERGVTQQEIAREFGVSQSFISKKIAQIQNEQGVLLQYRALQSLQLTRLQAEILDCITPEKINDASLRDLVLAFKILKDKELTLEGKPSDIKGLVGYLVQLEKEDAALAAPADPVLLEKLDETIVDIMDDDYIPDL